MEYENGTEAQILDIIDVTIVGENPLDYQPENYTYDSNHYWSYVRQSNLDEVLELVNQKQDQYVFFNSSYKLTKELVALKSANEIYSLKIIELDEMNLNAERREGRLKYHASFRYNNNSYRFIKVTDDEYVKAYPSEGEYQIKNATIIVSLADLYDFDNCHYKLIASILHP